jgi:CubicO group peptidase (beta-lactamase class C family)
MRWSMSAVLLSSAAASLASSSLAQTVPSPQSYVQAALVWLRHRDHNPGIAALVQIDGKIAAEAAIGVRALDHPESVTVHDRWHIGSCTKAFTATLIGRLAERKVMSMDDTLEESLPELAKTMHPAYRHVTVRQLLSHTAGLPPLTNTETEFPTAVAAARSAQGVLAQRAAIARYYLTSPPTSVEGTFAYSNLGYVIAAAIAERHTGKTWESLLREFVFGPLGITNVGFGPPGHTGKDVQPLGHAEISGKLVPLDPGNPASDIPAWLGPAGAISISLKSWALFAQDQLEGAHGHGKLLKQPTYRALQTPVVENYALGWGVLVGADGSPILIEHEGSNGYWTAEIHIYPEKNTIVLAVTNFGSAAARKSIRDFSSSVAEHLQLIR